ncbi:MAG: PDDEXK nuclease domain-containing protein [Pseudomonadales bacterium]
MVEITSLTQSIKYKSWLKKLKYRWKSAQLKAAVSVNSELLTFYWGLGADIVEQQKQHSWGDGFLKQLSHDLMTEFPNIKGFSRRNLEHIRRWYLFYLDPELIAKQLVSQLTQIPWGHNIVIISKCDKSKEAIFYVQSTLEHGWSRSVLTHQIESDLWRREGQAISNFSHALTAPQSDLAQQTLRDPYVFDFINLTKRHTERELEQELIQHISSFLLELGAGFAYVGKQVSLEVGEREFFLDLLFYHTQLHCYVVIELKTVDFDPEHAGKLNFYIKAVDEKLKKEGDNPTIGLLLCKSRDNLVAEWALSDIHKPIGISEYQLSKFLPKDFQSSLPSTEDIETELSQDFQQKVDGYEST